MRKILVGVLSVAGLLAAVLALASSPAAAVKNVITITSDTEAGVYTVTWRTKGGCNPNVGTTSGSGATGSVTLTVVDSTPNDDATNEGTAVESGVVIDTICTYEWEAALAKADGPRCKVTVPTTGSARTLAAGACNSVEKVTFTVAGYTTPASGGNAAVPPTAAVLGAIKNTTFTVTATEKVPSGAKADPQCATVSDDTEVSDAGHTQVELTLVDATFNGRNCTYTVTAALPDGFAAGAKGSNSAVVVMNGSPSSGSDPPDNRATLGKAPAATSTSALSVDLAVTVATRTVYLVQNVIGDAGNAGVEYKYSPSCGAPGLPAALQARSSAVTGGIITNPAVTIVELRTGRYNVSAGIGDLSADGTKAGALNSKAEACEAAVSVSGVPAGCTVKHNSPVNLVSSGDTVIIEFTIDCTAGAGGDGPVDVGDPGDELVDTGDSDGDGMEVADGDADGAADGMDVDLRGDDADDADGMEVAGGDADGAADDDMREIDGGGSAGPPRDSATG